MTFAKPGSLSRGPFLEGVAWGMRYSSSMAFTGKTIRDSGLREETDGLIVGLEREGKRILNPDSTIELLSGDLLWIVGDRNRISKLQ